MGPDGYGRIEEFIKDHFPELQAVDLSGTALDKWMDELDDLIEQVLDELDIGYDEYSHLKLMRSLQYWALNDRIGCSGSFRCEEYRYFLA